MTPELLNKWTAALRSGDYKQGDGYLHHKDKFCCLGVLANVCGATWDNERGMYGEGIPFIDGVCVRSGPEDEFISADFAEKVGLEDQHSLAEMNDAGTPFTEIADYIEANL